ncbi:Ubiquitin carboxyl-terminal hydrolase 20 [Platanthera guangdongensis]|uniref:Ubiquitin carboxyl-terminal hydrolase n=1 Tax=Platanthera guangdongensis TaxID=2320717 RepID=A0ABR2N1X9_9ASPA
METPSLIFHPPPVGAGLNNLGNTCFMNAVLQCITHTVPFVEKLHNNNHTHACSDKDGDFCSFCALRSHVYESIMKSGLVVTPRNLAYNLSKISAYFQPGEQQDAHEFLSCLLDSIHTSYLKPISKDHHHLSYRGDSPVNQVFGGLLRSRLRCLDCGHSSDTYEAIVDLSLEIDDVDNLTSALESFTKAETIDDPDIKFTCEGCKSQVSMEKQLKIEQPPNVIALHLKRFTNIEYSALKISKFVKYPIELDLMPFMSSPGENDQFIYELYGIVVHSGSCHSGHYYCDIRTSPSSWYQMNDSLIDVISESDVLDLEAYIVFYIKKGSSPWFSCLVESQKIPKMDINMNASPSSVLDCEDDDDTSSSAREASSSNSREMVVGMLEKGEVSSPHARSSQDLLRDETEANSPVFPRDETEANSPVFQRDEIGADNATSHSLSGDTSDKNGTIDSPGRRFLLQHIKKPSDVHISHILGHAPPLVAEDERKTHTAAQKHVVSQNNNQNGKFLMENAHKADKSLTRIMRTMPNSRRAGFLACLQSSPEPSRKRPIASKSDQPLKRRQKMSSHSDGKGGFLPGSSKAKSLSPLSLRRILIEDDSESFFEYS